MEVITLKSVEVDVPVDNKRLYDKCVDCAFYEKTSAMCGKPIFTPLYACIPHSREDKKNIYWQLSVENM